MSALDERRRIAETGVREDMDGFAARVILQPIAAPSILGLAGFAGATFIVVSNLAGWWGDVDVAAGARAVRRDVRRRRDRGAEAAEGSHTWVKVAGWVLVVSAGLAWYVAAAMLLAASFGRTVLPLLKYGRSANVPGRRATRPIELEWAEPGVRLGQ